MSKRRCPRCHGTVTEPARCSNGHAQVDDPAEVIAALLATHLNNRLIDHERLADALAHRLERFVADLLAPVPEPSKLLTASELAQRIGKSRRWVYEHKELLGATTIGNGPRPRLFFDTAYVDRVMKQGRMGKDEKESPAIEPSRQGTRRRGAPLLAVKGRAA